nr:prepilin-type N-terminal cleavage/methylation domain-containing protein [Pelovirga terrestris]
MHSKHQRGLTLLELAVVVLVISVVGLVALHYYYKLMVDIERTTMERDVSAMRTAIGLQIAAHYAGGRMAELEGWTGGNPMVLLVAPPENYGGVVEQVDLELKKGRWYFDKSRGVLIYLARNRFYFESELDSPARAEFRLEALFTERQSGETVYKQVSGLELKTIHPYRWVSPWG